MPDACVNFDHPGTKKAPQMRGFHEERMKGLEPSTFCMASRRSSQLSYIRRVDCQSILAQAD